MCRGDNGPVRLGSKLLWLVLLTDQDSFRLAGHIFRQFVLAERISLSQNLTFFKLVIRSLIDGTVEGVNYSIGSP